TKVFSLKDDSSTTVDSTTLTTDGDAVPINLTATSATSKFTLLGSNLTGYTGTMTVTASETGSNAYTYVLGNSFGTVVIAGHAADTLDFSTNTHTISFDGTTFTESPGNGSLTFTGTPPSHIDISTTAQFTNDVQNAFSDLKSAVNSADAAISALSNALP